MSHTAYWITPDDVAVYLFLENTSHQRENEILWDVFENHKTHIPTEYGSTYLQFKQSVMNLLNIYELDAVSYDEAALILMETEHTSLYSEEESDCFDAYFKLIWLQLRYSGIAYRKVKLRKLLRDFGYKRRSEKLTSRIQQAIDKLELKTYLRGYVPCSIDAISLEDVIVIRLSEGSML